jgi:S-formylglutathione hydrolase FrmB
MKIFLTAFLFCIVLNANAATTDSVVISSRVMKKEWKCVVIKPQGYSATIKPYPVVYLLHGWSGAFDNWIKKVPAIESYSDKYQVIIVCPDGGYSSWYFDSPVDPNSQYETYIGEEVPAYIDKHYNTIKDRKGRAITGLSMGGHGAFYLALRHADRFGACSSMSGGLDINASRGKFDIMKRIGDTITHADNWKKYTVINVVDQYPKDSLRMLIDCGTEDFYFPANRHFHEKLLQMKIPHEFFIRPGAHNWAYWANAVEYHLLFFRRYFDGK